MSTDSAAPEGVRFVTGVFRPSGARLLEPIDALMGKSVSPPPYPATPEINCKKSIFIEELTGCPQNREVEPLEHLAEGEELRSNILHLETPRKVLTK
jgi:hypothetical protein